MTLKITYKIFWNDTDIYTYDNKEEAMDRFKKIYNIFVNKGKVKLNIEENEYLVKGTISHYDTSTGIANIIKIKTISEIID